MRGKIEHRQPPSACTASREACCDGSSAVIIGGPKLEELYTAPTIHFGELLKTAESPIQNLTDDICCKIDVRPHDIW